MKKITVRKMTTDDTKPIRQLHRRVWLDTYPNQDAGVSYDWVNEKTEAWMTPEALDNSKKRFQSILDDEDNQYYRVVEVDGKIRGFVHGSRLDSETGEQTIDAIYIDKSLQGTGVAQQLMDDLLKFLDTSKDTWLEVASYNGRAKAFYQKYGFKVVEGSGFRHKDDIPCVKMIRKGGQDEI